MNMRPIFFLILIAPLLLTNCAKKAAPVAKTEMKMANSASLQPCIVYKTRSDYNKLVPVILSPDKTTIVSYPDIKDVFYKGKLAYPTELAGGYLLDNRGIGPDVAFLNYTYDEYSRMFKTPVGGELWKRMLDKDPLLEMYQCGNRTQYKEIEKELNDLIISGKIKDYKRLK